MEEKKHKRSRHNRAASLKWCHFQSEIILLCVRWYLPYILSYRDLEEIMVERGISLAHTTIFRWVQHYALELEKQYRPHLTACNDSWKVDETYIKVMKVWMYPYQVGDSEENTIEFFLSPTPDAEAAKRFFCKALMSLPLQLLKRIGPQADGPAHGFGCPNTTKSLLT